MLIREAMEEIFEKVVNPSLLIRRINVTAHNIIPREQAKKEENIEQLNLFVDYEKSDQQKEVLQKQMEKEQNVQETLLQIQQKYGKNAVLRGMNLEEGATAKQRNEQIGGHKA
jgi:DNA polymerase V